MGLYCFSGHLISDLRLLRYDFLANVWVLLCWWCFFCLRTCREKAVCQDEGACAWGWLLIIYAILRHNFLIGYYGEVEAQPAVVAIASSILVSIVRERRRSLRRQPAPSGRCRHCWRVLGLLSALQKTGRAESRVLHLSVQAKRQTRLVRPSESKWRGFCA